MSRKVVLSIVLLVLMVVVTACAPSGGGSAPAPTAAATSAPAVGAATQEVVMKNRKFVPAELTIKAGTTVRWTNQDTYGHTVTSGTREAPTTIFDSPVAAGQSFSFTFKDPGVYPYHCTPHQGMDGTITVQ
jgi:plastocyanin